MDLEIFAAKSDRLDAEKWLPFHAHAWDTAEIMERLLCQWLPDAVHHTLTAQLFPQLDFDRAEEQLAAFCRLLGLLHDTGKLTPAFQSKIASSIAGHTEKMALYGLQICSLSDASRSPHQLAGQVILEENGFSPVISTIVGFHHGKGNNGDAFDQLTLFPENYFGRKCSQKQQWQEIWRVWIRECLEEAGFSDIWELPVPDVRSQMLLTGLVIMADWIASNADYFPYIPTDMSLNRMECRERATDAWERLALPPVLNLSDPCFYAEQFEERFGFPPNTVQQEILELLSNEPAAGLLILEAPMGLGKTEAALAAAELLTDRNGAGGVYFGLPTQATANGVFGRIRDWASGCDPEHHSIRLAHGSAELNEEYQSLFHGTAVDSGDDGVIVHEWFEGRKQAMLADFVIATVDQFLLASLKQKHVMLRHLGLAGKVVILDECHAYDAYMNVYLDRTLAWMGAYGVPMIVLSATLPPRRRNEMLNAYLNRTEQAALPLEYAYPVLTWTSGNSIRQQALTYPLADREIGVMHLPEQELTAEIASRLQKGGCAAVIVNTVAFAQSLYSQLRSDLPDHEVICIHSRFIATDRAKIEKMLLERVGKHSCLEQRHKLIVVGTQVLEQSLDLDFDFMVTELCPMDLLLQRSGRLHRHDRVRPAACEQPVLAILKPAEPAVHSIYEPWLLEQTAEQLPDVLRIPSCIPELVSSVYEAEDENSEAFRDYTRHIQEKREKAKKYCIKSSSLNSRRTRTLLQILDDDAGNSEEAERSVRDGEETIEVLVLRQDPQMQYRLVSGAAAFDPTRELDEAEAKMIARERLRLPLTFSKSYHYKETVAGLHEIPERWRESRWLAGELLLLLDESLETELIGRHLRYSPECGLEIIQKEQG